MVSSRSRVTVLPYVEGCLVVRCPSNLVAISARTQPRECGRGKLGATLFGCDPQSIRSAPRTRRLSADILGSKVPFHANRRGCPTLTYYCGHRNPEIGHHAMRIRK